MRSDELRAAVVAALGTGVLTRDALRATLGEPWTGAHAGRDELDRLIQLDTTFTQVAGGIAHVPSVLEGSTWTVWVDPAEAAEDFVRTKPWLSPLTWWLVDADVELIDTDGVPVGSLHTDGRMLDGRDIDVVHGPAGWLDAVAGGWAAVEVVGGALQWSPATEPPSATPRQLAAIRIGFEAAIRSDDGLDVEPLPAGLRFAVGDGPVHEAIHADRDAFLTAAIPPLPELYTAAGLVLRDGILAEPGFDWDALLAWQDRSRFRFAYGLAGERATALAGLVATHDRWSSGGDDAIDATTLAAAARALDDGGIADAFWSELSTDEAPLADLGALADALEAAGGGPALGTSWLRARWLDLTGETAASLATLESVVDAGSAHRPALVDLAGFRADAGDAAGALRLLQRAGVGPHDVDGDLLWDEVEEFATHRPRPSAKRNDLCPCGSGRKYKVCHLGRETHGLDDRAGWLYLKAQRFLGRRHPQAAGELVELMLDPSASDDLFDDLEHAPFVGDLALHEDGIFAEFIAARDQLLPDDEALLAAQWALVDRSVFEILATATDRLELRDVTRGGTITVVNTNPNNHTRAGMLLVGRPLPVGATHRAFSGFMPVPDGHLDRMLAALDSHDAEEIALALSVIFRPPRLTNTDGEDLIAHTITWRVPPDVDIAAALVAAGLQAESEHSWTLVRDSQNQRNTVIASVALDGATLTGDANSIERATELRQIVAQAVPDADVIDIDARPLEMTGDPAQLGGAEPIAQDDPAIQAILREYIAEAEERWLDEQIPALGGRTPHQAAADPIGREDLVRLLASFPVPADDDVGAMNPDRLRAALGI